MNDRLKDDALSMIIKNELVKDTNIADEDRLNSYIDAFRFIYSDNYRHEYSKITRVLFDIEDPEQRDYISEQLKFISSSIEDQQIQNKLNKLSDHINLEIIRMRELSRIAEDAAKASEKAINIEEKVNESTSKMLEIDKKILDINTKTKNFDKKIKGFNQDINGAKKHLNTLHKSIKNTTTEFVTILSIFAAIVIGFTGGMTYISNAIISLGQIGPYRAGVFILLIGIIMFDTIFLLLYMIAKLTDKYIGSIGKCKNGGKFCNTKTIGCCLNRYPYVIFFNASIILLIISVILLYGVDRYNIISMWVNYFIKDFNWYKLFILIATLIITYFTLKQIRIYDKFKNTINKVINYKCNCS